MKGGILLFVQEFPGSQHQILLWSVLLLSPPCDLRLMTRAPLLVAETRARRRLLPALLLQPRWVWPAAGPSPRRLLLLEPGWKVLHL